MSQYTMLSKYGNCTRVLQIKSRRILDILWAFLIKQLSTIWYPTRTRGIIVKYTGLIDTGSGRDSTQHDIKQFG